LPTEKDYDRVVKPVHSALQRMRSKGVVTPIARTTGPGGGAIVWDLALRINADKKVAHEND